MGIPAQTPDKNSILQVRIIMIENMSQIFFLTEGGKMKKTSVKKKAAERCITVVMLILTAIYPLFMTSMTAAGIIYHRTGYGDISVQGVLLLASSLMLTAGAVLSIFRKKLCSILSASFLLTGSILCIASLKKLMEHADRFGWTGHGRYEGIPVSDMYLQRIAPAVIPVAAAIYLPVKHYADKRDS